MDWVAGPELALCLEEALLSAPDGLVALRFLDIRDFADEYGEMHPKNVCTEKTKKVFEDLKDYGYCLWVGAGVAKQLSLADGAPNARCPDWLQLTDELETMAGFENSNPL